MELPQFVYSSVDRQLDCFQMFKLDLEKAKPGDRTASLKKQENSSKTSTSASLTILKTLTVWIITNCGKSLKRWDYHTTLPAS